MRKNKLATPGAVIDDVRPLIHLRESHIRLVGQITVTFGLIESNLNTFVARLINPNDLTPAYLALDRLTLVSTIDIARTLFPLKESNPDLQAEFDKILGSIDQLRVTRNQIVHSFSDYDDEKLQVEYLKVAVDKKRHVHLRDTSFTIKQFEDLLTRVKSAHHHLILFCATWRARQQPNTKL